MELSRELFKQIVAQLRGGGDSHDKRKTPRVGLRNHVHLTQLKGSDNTPGDSYHVVVRDLSPDGIGFLHHRRIAVNCLFAIRLPALEVGMMVAIYKVRHCDMLENDLFRIGGLLVKVCDQNSEAAQSAPKPTAALAARMAEKSKARKRLIPDLPPVNGPVTPNEKGLKVPQPAGK
jgi:hypothetical protein